ncbi:MAG: DNA primase [Alphaproteobacteria bacterium]|nr:DNA primase [Alphaproteobacteria bacterium]
MFFDSRFLEELKQRVSLHSVISRSVKLQKRGHSYVGLCPFHSEKTGSFVVDESKGFYHCFGCGAHGNVIDYVMNHEHLGFVEAVRSLALEAHMPLPKMTENQVKAVQKRTSLYDLTEKVCQFYQEGLSSLEGAQAREYLQKRQVSKEMISKFRLGYSSSGKLASFLKKEGFSLDDAVAVGLFKKSDYAKAPHEYFRNRLIFPIMNKTGKIISFGGRILGEGEPKYLNGPETELFHKSDVLYGLKQAYDAIYKKENVLVVEGYMDVISLHQAGVDIAVAPLGTALTESHLNILWHMVSEPTLCFDGDGAGIRAAYRGCDKALPLLTSGKSLKFVWMPEGVDPDDYIKMYGGEAFWTLISNALPLFQVVLNKALEGKILNTPERKAGLKKELTALAEEIKDKQVSSFYLHQFLDEFYRLCRENFSSSKEKWKKSSSKGFSSKLLLKSVPVSFKGREDMLLLLSYLACYPLIVKDFLEDYMTLALEDVRLENLKNKMVEFLLENEEAHQEGMLKFFKTLPEKDLIQNHVEMLLKSLRQEHEIRKEVKILLEGISLRALEEELDSLCQKLIKDPSNQELFERYTLLKTEKESLLQKLSD